MLLLAGPRSALLRGGDGAGPLTSALLPHVAYVDHDPFDLTALSAAGTGAILYDGDVLSVARVLVAMRQAGIDTPLWGGPALGRAQLPQIAGSAAADSCYAVAAPVYADLSPGSAFSAGYLALAGVAPGPWAALAYDAARLLLDATERAVDRGGRITREGVRAALAAAHDGRGQRVFEDGRRVAGDLVWYCYDGRTPYPGRPLEAGSD
jgi:ABC-type branched-subunit amino acid transport system substrate-binding protein